MALESTTARKASDSKNKENKRDRIQMPFTAVNFWMMAACVAMIIIGFALMSGGAADTDTAFNPEIFSTRRLVVGPTIAFLGFLFMAFAIIWTPKKKKNR